MSKTSTSPGGYDDLQGGIRSHKLPEIDTFANIYSDRDYTVELEILEFNSICPKTGLPDFGEIRIEYVPDKLCAETKSLKLYITAFRDLGIFQENAVNRVLDDFVRQVRPRTVTITGDFNPRGGIGTTVTAQDSATP
jgi:7-cyano-7-deazaguanine reductase